MAFDDNGRKESECKGLLGKGLTRLDIRRVNAFICEKLWLADFFDFFEKTFN
ncbi:hypothetical protein [Pediococcus parvulus]|uniref:hypothetical protein n=1 Tax=Pediococcus parvulus TaxID=54062 RepID=UPI00345E9CE6